MKSYHLSDMIQGWFIGMFTPSLYVTKNVEVSIQNFKKNDYKSKHFHKIATEITVVISGKVEMNKKIYSTGSIIKIFPGESTDFKVLDKTTIVVVKLPSVSCDKYVLE